MMLTAKDLVITARHIAYVYTKGTSVIQTTSRSLKSFFHLLKMSNSSGYKKILALRQFSKFLLFVPPSLISEHAPVQRANRRNLNLPVVGPIKKFFLCLLWCHGFNARTTTARLSKRVCSSDCDNMYTLSTYPACSQPMWTLFERRDLSKGFFFLASFYHLLKVTGHSKNKCFCRVSPISKRLFLLNNMVHVRTFKGPSLQLFRFKISQFVIFLIKNPQNLFKICKKGTNCKILNLITGDSGV